MSSNPQKYKSTNFGVGVLNGGPTRTQLDLDQIKDFDTSNTPDNLPGSKENYCGTCKNKQDRPSRTLAWDDSDNPRSYYTRR